MNSSGGARQQMPLTLQIDNCKMQMSKLSDVSEFPTNFHFAIFILQFAIVNRFPSIPPPHGSWTERTGPKRRG
jgi:hypothetical protein